MEPLRISMREQSSLSLSPELTQVPKVDTSSNVLRNAIVVIISAFIKACVHMCHVCIPKIESR